MLDGQVFDWDGDGLKPGEEFGCRCIAEPLQPEASSNVNEVQVANLGAIAAFAAAAARILARTGSKIKKPPTKLPKDPPVKPVPKPASKPIEKPNLNDTKTWPKPARGGEFKEGVPSRSKPNSRGEKSLYDEKGGEWRYSPGDKYHNEHWDYKAPGKNQSWENVPIGDKSPVK